ncbi:YidB family protein [Streptomyces sp. NPDC051018]|uniref:YidB family protein n=1 Tax=Streptomyces sp. NPDC051018 TaxID=3365639 RepID=UPI0037AC68B0
MAADDLGTLLGGLLGDGRSGGSGGGSGTAHILGTLLSALGSRNGASAGGNPLDGLIGMLARSGLLEQAKSWVGTGENKPVSGAQIADALPGDTLRRVAEENGVTPQQAADEIARSLPRAVDRLTPSGELPQAGTSLEDAIRRRRL